MVERAGEQNGRPVYVGFANARLPDTDYRVAFAALSQKFDVRLALPERPAALPGRQFISLNVREGLSLEGIASIMRIPRILKSNQATVAHFFATQFVLTGPALAKLVGVRSVVTVTGRGRAFEASGWRRLVFKILYGAMFRLTAGLSDAVLFQNADDMEEFKALLPSQAHKMSLIGSAIDERYFARVDSHSSILEGLPICLMVARVQAAKGIEDFLHVAERLQGRAKFVLVGPPGNGAANLMDAVLRSASAGYIEYMGALSDADVRNWYQRTSVVVIPSRTEGLPRVALESALSHVPVVAYDIPGCRAALPAAALVPSFDLAAFEGRLVDLLGDSARRRSLAKITYEWVAARYGAVGYVSRMECLLRERVHIGLEASGGER